ncbi:MAG TPA: hypothetical protein VN708_03555 [Terriglobales bacterium]|nr:hypothetical protein [Terriglobales bacterium]
MAKQGKYFTAMSFGLVASIAAVWPVQAQGDIEDQIKALESEVQKIEPLKDQIERLRYQQLEMKKEATAAAAEMPTFSYRPGRGLTIAGADKSWSFNTTYRVNIYNYNIIGGRPNYFNPTGTPTQRSSGTTFGELFPRRNRIYTTFCWQDCFYQMENALDGETAERAASFRDNEFTVGFNQLNPYLPYYSIGLRRGAGKTHVGRSSDNDGKMEHSMILDGFAWGGDGSHAGMGLGWDGVDIGEGEYDLFLNLATSRQGTHQEFVNDDRKGIMGYIGGRPFANTKSKWLSGLEMGVGYQGQSIDRPSNSLEDDTAGVQIRVRNVERRGRQDLFFPAVITAGAGSTNNTQNIGGGWGDVIIPGLKWTVGPYMFRAVYVTTRYDSAGTGQGRGIWGKGFTFDHQLMLWSPKGFLTGSQTTPNTVMVSFGFERAYMNCGRGCDASPGSQSFHSQSVLNREAALWYWLQPSLGFGMWWHYWTSANTPYRTQVANGCKDNVTEALSGKSVGRSCSWHSVNTGLRFRW